MIRHLKKTSQRHLTGVSKRLLRQLSVFKISKRQLFCKSNQCLSKQSFIHIFGNRIGHISGCPPINFCEIQGWLYLILAIILGFLFKFLPFFTVQVSLLTHKSFCIRNFRYLIVNSTYGKTYFRISMKVLERRISGFSWSWEKYQ